MDESFKLINKHEETKQLFELYHLTLPPNQISQNFFVDKLLQIDSSETPVYFTKEKILRALPNLDENIQQQLVNLCEKHYLSDMLKASVLPNSIEYHILYNAIWQGLMQFEAGQITKQSVCCIRITDSTLFISVDNIERTQAIQEMLSQAKEAFLKKRFPLVYFGSVITGNDDLVSEAGKKPLEIVKDLKKYSAIENYNRRCSHFLLTAWYALNHEVAAFILSQLPMSINNKEQTLLASGEYEFFLKLLFSNPDQAMTREFIEKLLLELHDSDLKSSFVLRVLVKAIEQKHYETIKYLLNLYQELDWEYSYIDNKTARSNKVENTVLRAVFSRVDSDDTLAKIFTIDKIFSMICQLHIWRIRCLQKYMYETRRKTYNRLNKLQQKIYTLSV